MRNITVSVDEETHRQARIRAAELDTSVSALVREFLTRLSNQTDGSDSIREVAIETPLERRRRILAEVFAEFDARGVGLQMSENRSREELYDRDAARAEARAEAAPPPQLE